MYSLAGSVQRDCHLDALEVLGPSEAGQDEVAAAALAPPHALAGLAVPRLQAAVALPHLQARTPDRRPALGPPATAPPRRPRQHPRLQMQKSGRSDKGTSRKLLCSAMTLMAANAEKQWVR